MSWDFVKLSDCCISISDGDHQPPPKADEGIPFVTISDITSYNQFNFENVMYVPDEYYESLDEKRKARMGDVLYSVVGSYGIPILIKEPQKFVFQRHIAILRPNTNVDSRYLYYAMKNPTFYAHADSVAIGAAQKTISLSALKDLKIPLPPLPIQRRIADILSAYDDLIENNQRQIKLLEEAAMRLYREWFVFMRFPGHESVRIVDGVPEGWEKKKVSSIMKFVKGKNLGDVSFEKLDGYEKLLLLDGLESDVTTYGCAEKQVLAKDGDILMLMDGARSSHTFITDAGIVGSTLSLIEITENQIPVSYVKGYFDANLNLFVNNNTGSAIPHANRKFIEGSDILIPNLQLLENYDNISGVFLKRVRSLNHMNQQLRISRDALLPRLMNGGEGLKLEGGAV